MAEPSVADMTMAHDAGFLDRIQYIGCKLARDKLADATATDLVKNYCKRFLANPAALAVYAAVLLVSDPSVTGTWAGAGPSTVTDAALYAAWNANVGNLAA